MIKCLIYIFFVCSCVAGAFGQEMDSIKVSQQIDSLETEKKVRKRIDGGIYLEFQLESVPSLGKRNFNQQFGIGMEYKHLNLGFYQNVAMGNISRTLIFPNDFDLIYSYGGGYLGVRAIQNDWFEIDLRVNYGLGDMVWERSDTKIDFTRDKFQLIKPELSIAFSKLPFFRLYGLVGYRHFVDLDITSADGSDFSGVTFAVGLKIGYFQ